jgi:rod shape-determining protein MreC
MNNLWNLLVRYHLMLTFLVCQGLALSWFFSSHGYPRGKWVRASLAMSNTWDGYVSDMSQLSGLANQNDQLLLENAQLRSQLLRFLEDQKPLLTESKMLRTVFPAEVIRSSTHLSSNYMILNKGLNHGLKAGQGGLHSGYAIGKIVEATPNNALLLPLIHTHLEWSARVGQIGPVGRLIWDGKDTQLAYLEDIPRSTKVSPGDTIVTSGFQGIFPPELIFGFVTPLPPEQDGEFQRIQIRLGAPFQSLRYIHVIDNMAATEIDSLVHSVP